MIVRQRNRRSRPGFTLLEVMLASAISLLLIASLYFAFDMTIRQTEISREIINADQVARTTYNRFALDLSGTLAPLPPKSGGNTDTSDAAAAAAAGTSSTSGSSGSSTAGTTGSSTSGTSGTSGSSTSGTSSTTGSTTTSTTSSSTTSSTTTTNPNNPNNIPFQVGVIGTNTQLTIFTSRTPDVLLNPSGLSTTTVSSTPIPSDLRRIDYWVANNGGLARTETATVTDVNLWVNLDPDKTNEATSIIVDEVETILFEYYDGTTWQESWNYSSIQMSPDGVTPTGPPMAVRVTMTFKPLPDQSTGKQVAQVVPVRAAPGTNTPPLVQPNLDPGTTSSGSSASSTASGGSGSGGSAASGGMGSGANSGSGGASGSSASKGGSGGTGSSSSMGGASSSMSGGAASGGGSTGAGSGSGTSRGTTGGGTTGGSTAGGSTGGGSTGGSAAIGSSSAIGGGSSSTGGSSGSGAGSSSTGSSGSGNSGSSGSSGSGGKAGGK